MPSVPACLKIQLCAAPVSRVLVAANLLVFAGLAVRIGAIGHLPGVALIPYGSNFGPLTLGGQPWRLLSSLFIHGGVLHLGLNLLALWQVGAVVEPLFGRWRFLLLYLGAGVLAGIASLWWQPQVNSVGASGAIFGIFSALLVDLRLHRDLLPGRLFRRMRTGLLSFLAFSLFAGVVLPGIDNAAHLGGLIGGVLLGYVLAPRSPGSPWPDVTRRALVALAWLALALAAWRGT